MKSEMTKKDILKSEKELNLLHVSYKQENRPRIRKQKYEELLTKTNEHRKIFMEYAKVCKDDAIKLL